MRRRIRHDDGTQTVWWPTGRIMEFGTDGFPVLTRQMTPAELAEFEAWAATQPGWEEWQARRMAIAAALQAQAESDAELAAANTLPQLIAALRRRRMVR